MGRQAVNRRVASRGKENTRQHILEAARAYGMLYEIHASVEEVFGAYREPGVLLVFSRMGHRQDPGHLVAQKWLALTIQKRRLHSETLIVVWVEQGFVLRSAQTYCPLSTDFA
jgi:hypothetical protein